MWQLKKVASCLGLIILFEVVKIYLKVKHADIASYYFFSNLLSCYQILVLFFCIITIVSDELIFKRFFKSKFRILSAGLFLLVMIVCESICAYLIHHPKSISKGLYLFQTYYREFDMSVIQFDKKYSEYDSSLFYTLKDQAEFMYTNPEFSDSFRTNSQGFRDDEASLIDPAILFLGDSYTLGWGVEQNDTYPSIVEKKTGLNGLNTGVSSYGTARESIVLSSLDTSHVDFIIWQYCYNDEIENKTFVDNKFVLPIRSRDEYNKKVKEVKWNATYFPGKYFLTVLNLYREHVKRKPHDISAVKARLVDKGKEEAARFLAILERSNINWDRTRVIVLELNPIEKGTQFITSLQKLVNQEAGKRDFLEKIMVLDVKPLLGKEDYYILDIHLTRQGNIKLGNHLADIIKSLQNK